MTTQILAINLAYRPFWQNLWPKFDNYKSGLIPMVSLLQYIKISSQLHLIEAQESHEKTPKKGTN